MSSFELDPAGTRQHHVELLCLLVAVREPLALPGSKAVMGDTDVGRLQIVGRKP